MRLNGFTIWVTASVLAIIGISLTWWEAGDVLHSSLALVAAVTGILYTLLAGRGKIACYAFGLVNAPLYAYLSYRWGYYGDLALNLYYFGMMFPGIVAWRRHQRADETGEIVRTRLSGRDRWIWLAANVAATCLLWLALRAVGGNRPFCDALTNILSIAAMILTVKRCLEQWVMWIAVDAIELVMWGHTGATSMAILAMWALFLADGCYCFGLWISEMRRKI